MADETAPDTAASSGVTDHPHDSGPNHWARCWCGLAEAAHAESATPYEQMADPYRCPFCVDQGAEVCSHGPKGALALDGSKL